MAKTIKFNLICNNAQVRTLEDLRNNFAIEDVFKYYQNHLLERWLQVHNYTEHLSKVQAIGLKPKKETIIELIKVFEVETDMNKVNEGIYIMDYEESRILFQKDMEAKKLASSESLNKYLQRYEELKNDIVKNGSDKARIQAIINEIVTEYYWIFQADYRNLFYQIREESLLAVLCLLMNPKTRNYYIFDESLPSEDSIATKDIQEMYTWIKEQINSSSLAEKLGQYLVEIQKDTEGMFVQIEQRCMILKIVKKYSNNICHISNQGDQINFMKPEDVNNKFLIFDGPMYRTNSMSPILYYIEV